MRHILAAAALTLAFAAGAVTKSVTFTAPAAITSAGGWEVCLRPDVGAFNVPTKLLSSTRVCVAGSDGQSADCQVLDESTGTPPQTWIDFLNQRLAAWKVAKGY